MEKTYEKIQKLMNSYVPEFAYQRNSSDPGSVLTDLCADMLADSSKRYGHVTDKHRIQYLNLFDPMLKEPVTASKGYVQFMPVAGYEGMVPVPNGTQVFAGSDEGNIIFETEHDMTVCNTQPEMIVSTDRESDRILRKEYVAGESFYAFDVRGKNCTEHRLYLCFEELFDWVKGIDLHVFLEAASAADQQSLLEIFSSEAVTWSFLEPEGSETVISSVEMAGQAIRLRLADYVPQKSLYGQKEGYYLCVSCKKELPKVYIRTLKVGFFAEKLVPGELYINGVEDAAGGFLPFGKPLGLYNEFSFDDREALSRKGAKIRLNFQVSYRLHEERLEVPEIDMEYKAVMKKPRKPLAVRHVEVKADYVVWEYRSVNGWKRLFHEEYQSLMFNGSALGDVSLEFICPEDMADYGTDIGRIRARLLRAENVYQVPAVYNCPFFTGFTISYSYMDMLQPPTYAVSSNNFQEKNVTKDLECGGNVIPFYQTEHEKRAMYLGFPASAAGTPFSLYFDIENYSDRPIDFQVEYLSKQGFRSVRTIDRTDGFCGSGNMLFLVPTDMTKSKMYGYDGYFLRFISSQREHPEYTLPLIKGIYPNMAAVANRNTVTEEFYLDNLEQALEIQLNQHNLLKLSVQVKERTLQGEVWVDWKSAERIYEGGRTYQVEMAEGVVHFRKNAFAGFHLAEAGPHIRIRHSNYKGSKANLPAKAINVMGTAIRYISGVSNPFPTYGGYDGYTEETGKNLVKGFLHTRNRAVTDRDFFDMISQCTYGVRKVKCCSQVDAFGEEKQGSVTIAVLIDEYAKGTHVFSEMKKTIRDRLMKDSALLAMGRELTLIQPHFVRISVQVWLEKDSMEQAYDLQQKAKDLIGRFIDPLEGGQGFAGWEIGEFPRVSQIIACLRNEISGCNISKIVMTAQVDGREVPVTDTFYEKMKNPFLMAVNGEHVVYIEVK